MRKLKIIEHISLDGVIQAPGSDVEDPSNGFTHGGWVRQFADPVVGEAFMSAQGDSFDLLLGRKTYDIFADYWPHESNPLADSLNAARKYVATHYPETLTWGPVQGLGTDIVQGIKDIKAEEGPDLVLWGSSTITPVLIANGLAEDIWLLTYPILLGAGKRLFDQNTDPQTLTLVDTRIATTGVVVKHYQANQK